MTDGLSPETQTQTNIQPQGKSSRRRWITIVLVVILLLVGTFRLGVATGKKGFVFSPKDFKIINQNDQALTVDYNLLWQAIGVVNDKYIDRANIDQQEVLYGAIRGAVSAAGDEYTEFFDPKDLSNFRTELKGTFDGIGAEVGKRNNNIVIIAPLEGSPAQRAGLQPQDIIVQIDGTSTAEMNVDEAVSKIRGTKGTDVTLTIYREGRPSTFDVKITRDRIDIKSLKVSYQTINGKTIAVLKLSRFGDDTKDLFNQAVKDVQAHNVQGIVLDLRSNPGGYLDTAVDVASHWLPKGQLVVKEEHSQKDTTLYNSNGTNELGAIKTVILINGGSASASEIVAGALQDHGVAPLIGTKSFGKGSVQELVSLPGNSAVKVTIAKWITPNGKNLNKDGLVPNTEVKLSEEDINGNKDPQLDKALEEVAK
jgi:carboxyl-terminal processing protease